MKKGAESGILDDIPMMVFDDEHHMKGWKSIYLGLYSPYQNKYTQFMRNAIHKAKKEINQNDRDSKNLLKVNDNHIKKF